MVAMTTSELAFSLGILFVVMVGITSFFAFDSKKDKMTSTLFVIGAILTYFTVPAAYNGVNKLMEAIVWLLGG